MPSLIWHTCPPEYGAAQPLLIASGFADGDANEPEGSAYPAGFSRFPGNINELIFGVADYVAALEVRGQQQGVSRGVRSSSSAQVVTSAVDGGRAAATAAAAAV
eukprot:7055491-Prymnesium_polylepis.1